MNQLYPTRFHIFLIVDTGELEMSLVPGKVIHTGIGGYAQPFPSYSLETNFLLFTLSLTEVVEAVGSSSMHCIHLCVEWLAIC